MPALRPDSEETCRLLERIRGGDQQAVETLLARYRPDLRSFIEARLDPRMAARLDASDIVQEAQLEVSRRLADYLERQPMPFHLWVRRTAFERLLDVERHHLKRARRSVDREMALPERSSWLSAQPLVTKGSSPSKQLAARELAQRVSHAVAQLAQSDREVMLMRHAEGLSFDEIARLLDIEPATARKRFGRALIRLQKLLSDYGVME